MLTFDLRFPLVSLSLLGTAVILPQAAMADEEPYFSLSANAAIVTDYRFRGMSLSEKDPAIQGGFDVSTKSGFYVGTWGSSIQSYAGSEMEMDIYAGYKHDFDGFSTNIGVLAYTYPGSDDTHYIEAYGSIGSTFGIVDMTLGAAYVFSGQTGAGDQDNTYIYLDAAAPIADTPLSASARLAYEDGAFSFGKKKWEWAFGLSYAVSDTISVSAKYIDTNIDTSTGEGTVVLGLFASF